MASGRIHRLLRLILLLQTERPRGVLDLMDELGVSRRTLFRDLKMLQDAGIPCFHDPKAGGYRIARTFFLPPINLNVPETLGLMLMAKFAAAQRGAPMTASALSAIYKLITAVPEPMRAACGEMMANISVDPGPRPQRADTASAGRSAAGAARATSGGGNASGGGGNHNDEARWFATLQRCIDERRACRIVYKSPIEPEPAELDLAPYALHFAGRAWYVIGHSALHDEVRIFKLQRISDLEMLTRRFRRPRNFNAQAKLGQAWQLIPEGKVQRVELEFTALVATNVTEVLWHPSQQHKLLPDGCCRMTFQVDGLNEIAWWICGYADQVTVRKPAALKKRVYEMHRAAAERLK